MDSLKDKIQRMKANTRDRDLRQYINDDRTINYKKLLREEIATADENLLKTLNESTDDRCGKYHFIISCFQRELKIYTIDLSFTQVVQL